MNGLMALGFVKDAEASTDYRAVPPWLPAYLAGRRHYGAVCVQPVLVPADSSSDPVHCSLGLYDDEWGRLSTGRYEIAISERVTAAEPLDALHAAFALGGRSQDALVLLKIGPQDIPERRALTAGEIDRITKANLPHLGDQAQFGRFFSFGHARTPEWDDRVWRCFSALLDDAKATRAAHYLGSAISHVSLIAGPVDDSFAEFEEMPTPIREQVLVESSIQDCLKTVETVYGGMLSRDKPQVAKKLTALGIDPVEVCGFARPQYREEPLVDKLMRLRDVRDSKAAHGGTAESRRNSLYDLCDFQHAAAHVVLQHLFRGSPEALNAGPRDTPRSVDDRVMELARAGAYPQRRR